MLVGSIEINLLVIRCTKWSSMTLSQEIDIQCNRVSIQPLTLLTLHFCLSQSFLQLPHIPLALFSSSIICYHFRQMFPGPQPELSQGITMRSVGAKKHSSLCSQVALDTDTYQEGKYEYSTMMWWYSLKTKKDKYSKRVKIVTLGVCSRQGFKIHILVWFWDYFLDIK